MHVIVQKIFVNMCSKFKKLGAENFTKIMDVKV